MEPIKNLVSVVITIHNTLEVLLRNCINIL